MKVALSKLKAGEKGIIMQLDSKLKTKINSLGLVVGKKINVVSKFPLMGPLVVKTGNMKIAIGRRIANNVMVEK